MHKNRHRCGEESQIQQKTIMNGKRGLKEARSEKSDSSTYHLHGGTSGRMGLYEQLRRRLSKTSDLSFDSLKKARASLRVKRC